MVTTINLYKVSILLTPSSCLNGVSLITLFTYIHSITLVSHWGMQRSLGTILIPFATSTFIKFLIHAHRFRLLLTWPFSNTSPIWSRKYSPRVSPSSITTQICLINLFTQFLLLFKIFFLNFNKLRTCQNNWDTSVYQFRDTSVM
jgi:hypothetical protein